MSSDQTVLCRYHYDPLDRLAGHASAGESDTRLFYQKSRLATQIQGVLRRSVLQFDDQLLAQQQSSGKAVETALLATDPQRSVLQSMGASQYEASAYTAYGHLPRVSGLSSLLGFDGERRDPLTGHYLLGSGYRAFNPVLMRFNSPDSLSPFGEGGMNAYAYCQGDPVNYSDSDGHVKFNKLIRRFAETTSASPPPIPRAPTPRPVRPPNVSQSSFMPRASSSVSRPASALESSSRGARPSEGGVGGGPYVNIRNGRVNAFEFLDEKALSDLPEQLYKNNIKINERAMKSLGTRKAQGDITPMEFLESKLAYSRYMLREYQGRYGDFIAEDTRSKAVRTYNKRITDVRSEMARLRGSQVR